MNEAFRKVLDLQKWTVTNSCITIDGSCKLALQFSELDRDGKISNHATRKALVLSVSQKGELLTTEEISSLTDDKIIQEEVLINYTGKWVLVQVLSHDNQDGKPASF